MEFDYLVILVGLVVLFVEWWFILYLYIEFDEDDCVEGKKFLIVVYYVIVGLVCDGYVWVILMINFDWLLENVLWEVGVELIVVIFVDSLLGVELFIYSLCYVLKFYGDYKDVCILNIDEELGVYLL